jgi:hypothetical protein
MCIEFMEVAYGSSDEGGVAAGRAAGRSPKGGGRKRRAADRAGDRAAARDDLTVDHVGDDGTGGAASNGGSGSPIVTGDRAAAVGREARTKTGRRRWR